MIAKQRKLEVASLLLKLMKERTAESNRMLQIPPSAENNIDVKVLLDEAELLRDAFDVVMKTEHDA